MAMLESAMKQIPGSTPKTRNADALAIWKRHARRTNPERAYLAAAHFHDCDVDYQFDGHRWTATLREETQHADARRSLHRRKFRSPMPNRPLGALGGGNLGDGVRQSHWTYANQHQPEGLVGRRTRRASATAAAAANVLTSPKRHRTAGGHADTISPMEIVSAARSPPGVQASTTSEAEQQRREACERRQQLQWHDPDDHRWVKPEDVDARGNMVCSFTMAVTLAERVQTHARSGCPGHLTWSPRRMMQKGCCGRMVGVCTEGGNCKDCSLGRNGELVWESDELNEATGNLAANDLWATAIGASEAQYTGLATASNILQLGVPEQTSLKAPQQQQRTGVFNFIHSTIAPAVEALAEADFDRVLADAGDHPIAIACDAAHDAVRSAFNTVLATEELSQGLIGDVQTSSEGTSASREPALVETSTNKLEQKGKDVALIVIDGCKDLHAQIRARPRVNCNAVKSGLKPVEEAPATETAIDGWHGLKTEGTALPKQVKPSTAALMALYQDVIGPTAAQQKVQLTAQFLVQDVPAIIAAELRASFEREYGPFLEAATAATAAGLTWADACGDEEKLRQFGKVLQATGTIDLSILGDDEDDEKGELSLSPALHAVGHCSTYENQWVRVFFSYGRCVAPHVGALLSCRVYAWGALLCTDVQRAEADQDLGVWPS